MNETVIFIEDLGETLHRLLVTRFHSFGVFKQLWTLVHTTVFDKQFHLATLCSLKTASTTLSWLLSSETDGGGGRPEGFQRSQICLNRLEELKVAF